MIFSRVGCTVSISDVQNHRLSFQGDGISYHAGEIRASGISGGGSLNMAMVDIPAGGTMTIKVDSYNDDIFKNSDAAFTQSGFAVKLKGAAKS